MGVLKVLKGTLSTLGKKNRNGRIYSKELWENVLNSEYWHDMISNNSLFGECVHPADNRSTSDPFEIDANNVSHRISEAHIEGDRLIGTVEILDTDAGRNIASLIDSGCNIGISARGAGDLHGDEVDADTYQFKTFDLTFRPSDFNARLTPLTESEKKNFKPIKESEECDLLVNKTIKELTEQEKINKKVFKAIKESIDNSRKGTLYIESVKTTSDTGSYKVDFKYINSAIPKRVNVGYITESTTDEEIKDLVKNAISKL